MSEAIEELFECPVCLEKQVYVGLTDCGHKICSLCFAQCRQKGCPCCRAPITVWVPTRFYLDSIREHFKLHIPLEREVQSGVMPRCASPCPLRLFGCTIQHKASSVGFVLTEHGSDLDQNLNLLIQDAKFFTKKLPITHKESHNVEYHGRQFRGFGDGYYYVILHNILDGSKSFYLFDVYVYGNKSYSSERWPLKNTNVEILADGVKVTNVNLNPGRAMKFGSNTKRIAVLINQW